MGYTHEYSNYPQQTIQVIDYKNADDIVGTLINEIEALRSQGNYIAASEMIERYADRLRPYNIDTTTVNRLVEEIRNTQIKAVSAGQFLSYSDIEPVEVDEGFVWLGGE